MPVDDDEVIIILSNSISAKINKLPEDQQEKIKAILEKANKEVDKVLDRNPNL